MSMDDERYRLEARTVYEQLSKFVEGCYRIQTEYGRWLISSLLLLHSGAIAGLFYKSFENRPSYIGALLWFLAGIVLALASGFATWWNFSLAAKSYHKAADFRMLHDRNFWPTKMDHQGSMLATFVAAQLLGVLSLLALIVGVLVLYCTVGLNAATR